MKNNFVSRREFKNFEVLVIVIISALFNAFGVKIFMGTLHSIPAGTTGLSVLISQIVSKFSNMSVEYYIIYLILNLIIAVWGYYFVSKELVKKSLLFIISFTLFSKVLPSFNITDNKFINILSAGLCNGISNVVLIYVGATSGGFDFIGIYLSKRFQKSLMGTVNIAINYTIILVATIIFGVERGIISLIIVFINSTIIDRYHNQSNYISIIIVTNKPNLFVEYISEKLHRSSTIIKSKGSYSQKDNTTLLVSMSKHRFNPMCEHFKKIDPHAFISIYNVEQVIGNMMSKIGESAI